MTGAVIVAGLLMPVFWFGVWVPIMITIGRRYALPTAVAVALSVIGPIGALIGAIAGQARAARSRSI